MGGFGLLVELHREGSAPAALAAGFFIKVKVTFMVSHFGNGGRDRVLMFKAKFNFIYIV